MQFSCDGRPIDFVEGQTVGAALVAAGVRALRTTRLRGRPRAMFCGIGVCFDCLVIVDDMPGQRACLVIADEGMTVERQRGVGRDDLTIAEP